MRRYYVCKIIGDGTEFNAYRPAVADYPVAWVTVLGTDATGKPKKAWSLVLVNTVDHDQLLNDARIKSIPDATLDSTWGSLSTPVRNATKIFLEAEGIATAWIKTNTLIREIIRAIGKAQESGFSENNFDVAE